MVSLTNQDEINGQVKNLTVSVVGRNNVVEGTFDGLDLSNKYSYTASAVRRDLTTPLGRAISGTIPVIIFDTATLSTASTLFSTSSRTSLASVIPTISVSSSIMHMFPSTVKLSVTETKVITTVLPSSARTRSAMPSVTSVSRGTYKLSCSHELIVSENVNLIGAVASSSSKEFPMIGIIGIVCGIILLFVGIFGFVLTILSKTRHSQS